MAELYALHDIVPALNELEATMVALSPQCAERSQEMIAKQPLAFDILSDPGNAYAAGLGLRFPVPPELKRIYASFGTDLAVSNGEPSWTLPMPGRFVIDRTGVVRTVDVDPDYERRPEPEKTLADVRALSR